MRNPCRFFLEGKCKFGSKCKYDHVRYTSIVDPPQWIYSSYKGLDMVEISPEEVRFAMMCGDTKEVLDSFWIKNYMVLCGQMDLLESDARIESVTNRYVDPRECPDVFMAPFDTDRVLSTIYRMREQGSGSGNTKCIGQRGGYQRDDNRFASGVSSGPSQPQSSYDRGGYREREKNQYQGGFPSASPQMARNVSGSNDQASRGWGKDNRYGRKETGKPRKDYDSHYKGLEGSQGNQNGWRNGRDGTSRKYVRPEEEFDIQEEQPSFKGSSSVGPWNARHIQIPLKDNKSYNREADNRQDESKAEGDETDFIEEDFEYGKIPYSYRKPRE